jgi:hypothetical protein
MNELKGFQGYVEFTQRSPLKQWLRKRSTCVQRKERSRISTFSTQSRKRLHRECLKVLFSEDFYFVTLTYQASALDLGEEEVTWKKDLDTLRQRLRRCLPNLSALWKLEFTKSGLPHYHLLTHCPSLSGTELRNIIRVEWLKIIGSGSRGRFRHAVKVDAIGNMRAITRYMAKYISKDANDYEQTYCGRYWGYINKKDFPSGELHTKELNDHELEYVRRVLACVYVSPKYLDVKANLFQTDNSFAVYIPYACQRVVIDPLGKQ